MKKLLLLAMLITGVAQAQDLQGVYPGAGTSEDVLTIMSNAGPKMSYGLLRHAKKRATRTNYIIVATAEGFQVRYYTSRTGYSYRIFWTKAKAETYLNDEIITNKREANAINFIIQKQRQ